MMDVPWRPKTLQTHRHCETRQYGHNRVTLEQAAPKRVFAICPRRRKRLAGRGCKEL